MTNSSSACASICELQNRSLLSDPGAASDFCTWLQTSAELQGLSSFEDLVAKTPQLQAACAEFLPYGGGRPFRWSHFVHGTQSRLDLSPVCQTNTDLSPFLTGVGGVIVLLWFATFLLIIRKARKDRRYGLPIFPLCVMWGYETCFTFFYSFDGTVMLDVLEFLWFGLDTVLLVQLFRLYQPVQAPEPWRRSTILQRHHKLGFVLMALACLGGNYMLITYFDAGATLAYAVNFILSVSFIGFVLSRGNLAGISVAAVYTRAFAGLLTLWVTWVGFPFQARFTGLCERSPANPVALSMLFATVILDGIVLFGLLRRSPVHDA